MADRWAPFQPPGPVVPPIRIDPTGQAGPTPGAARHPRWRRVGNGFVVPSHVPRTPEQRIADALAHLPPGGVFTGWAALRMHGAAFLDGLAPDGVTELPVQIAAGPGQRRRPRNGVRHLQHTVPDVVTRSGVPCAALRWAVLDAMRTHDLREAVVVMDMVAAARLLSPERMATFLASRSWRGVAGIGRVRSALPLADEGSLSPPETRVRLVARLDAGLPPLLVNQPVFDRSGRLLGIPDLLEPVSGLAIEYDGDHHRSARRHSADVDREARLRRHLIEVTRVTGGDLRRIPALASRLRDAVGRARFLAPSDRPWTLTPPPWFREELPLDVQLDLAGS